MSPRLTRPLCFGQSIALSGVTGFDKQVPHSPLFCFSTEKIHFQHTAELITQLIKGKANYSLQVRGTPALLPGAVLSMEPEPSGTQAMPLPHTPVSWSSQGLLFLLANGSSVLHGCFRPGRTLPPPHSLPPGVSKSGPHTPQAMEVGPCPTRTSTAVAGPEPLALAPSAQHTSAEYWPDVPESSVAQQ